MLASDRQHCAVRAQPGGQAARAGARARRGAYWRALDDATGERDAKQRLEARVDDLERAGYTAAAKCLADDLDALVVHLRYPTRNRRRWGSTDLLERSLGEVKQRKVTASPARPAGLTLVWVVPDLSIHSATNRLRHPT